MYRAGEEEDTLRKGQGGRGQEGKARAGQGKEGQGKSRARQVQGKARARARARDVAAPSSTGWLGFRIQRRMGRPAGTFTRPVPGQCPATSCSSAPRAKSDAMRPRWPAAYLLLQQAVRLQGRRRAKRRRHRHIINRQRWLAIEQGDSPQATLARPTPRPRPGPPGRASPPPPPPPRPPPPPLAGRAAVAATGGRLANDLSTVQTQQLWL